VRTVLSSSSIDSPSSESVGFDAFECDDDEGDVKSAGFIVFRGSLADMVAPRPQPTPSLEEHRRRRRQSSSSDIDMQLAAWISMTINKNLIIIFYLHFEMEEIECSNQVEPCEVAVDEPAAAVAVEEVGVEEEQPTEIKVAQSAKKLVRKRVLDSDSEEPANGEPAVPAAPGLTDVAEALAAEKRRKLKKKRERRERKKAKKERKEKKLKEKSKKEEGGGGAGGDTESDDADASKSEGNDDDDDDKHNISPIDSEEIRDLQPREIDENTVAGGSDEEESVDEVAREALDKIDAAKKAEEESDDCAAAVAGAVSVERPESDAPFSALVKPIRLYKSNEEDFPRMLCAILCYVVTMDDETVGTLIREKVGEDFTPIVRESMEKQRDDVHTCDSPVFFEILSAKCDDKFNPETDLLEWRRLPVSRNVKSLRRAWIMVMLEQTNGIARMDDYSCAIGVYRLILNFSTSCVAGVQGGDIAMAACEKLVEPMPFHADDIERICKFKALCLTQQELKMYEFRFAEIDRLVNRTTIDLTKSLSNVTLPCFAGLPIEICTLANLVCRGVNPSRKYPVCEFMPVTFVKDTTTIKRLHASETTEMVRAAVRMNRVVTILPVYNLRTIKALMHGGYFHRYFYETERIGPTNISVDLTAEFVSYTNKQRRDSAVRASCVKWAERAEDLKALCSSTNSGQDYSRRLRDALRSVFSIVTRGTSAASSSSMAAANPTLDSSLVRHAQDQLYGKNWEQYGPTERLNLHAFLDWFGDLFTVENPELDICTRAFGIPLAHSLVTVHATEYIAGILMHSPTPYVVFFNSKLCEVRTKFALAIEAAFIPWLKIERPDAYADLLRRSGDEEQRAITVLTEVAKCIDQLEIARSCGERCTVLPARVAKDAQTQQIFSDIINVADSTVRIVSAGSSLFLVHAYDYAIEAALRYFLLNVVTSIKMGALESEDARLVLLRGATADDVQTMLDAELREEFANQADEEVGSKLLVIVQNEAELDHALFAMNECGIEARCIVTTAEQFCALGGSGPPGSPHKSWAKIYSSVLFYSAHRFSYDLLLRVVATLCGCENVPAVPMRMSPQQREAWTRSFRVSHDAMPTEENEREIERGLVSDMLDFAEYAVRNSVFDKITNDSPERLWGALSNPAYGAKTRFIFAYTAYGRPDSRDSRMLTPCGNPCEDMFFSNTTNPGVFRVVEASENGTLGTWLYDYWTDKRITFLPEAIDATNPSNYDVISIKLREAYRDGMRLKCPEESQQQDKQAREDAARAQRANAAASSGKRLVQGKLPDSFGVLKNNSANVVANWMRIANAGSSSPLPAYTPSVFQTNTLKYELAPRSMNFGEMSVTRSYALQKQRDGCTKVTYVVSAYPAGYDYMYLSTPPTVPLHVSQCYSPDVAGFGRSAMTEMMSRLRTNFSVFMIVADTARRLCLQCLVPSRRVSISNDQSISEPLRKDPSLAGEEKILKFVGLGTDASIKWRRHAHPYYYCLQSSSTWIWANHATTTMKAYNEMIESAGI